MLYIGSALAPTSVIASKLVPNFAPTASSSLLVAKPDRIELHDVTDTGLVLRGSLDVWGNVVAIEKVQLQGSKPHLIVLLAPPTARLVLLTYSSDAPHLCITSSLSLTPPTPSLRQAEFFASVVIHDTSAIVSLWIGVLSCVELELEKDKSSKRRRSSAVPYVAEVEVGDKRILLKETSNVNIREHNLLHLTFMPTPSPAGPLISFLYLSSSNRLNLQIRCLNASSRSFTDITKPIDVLSPLWHLDPDDDTDFPDIAFSCPAARRVLPLPASAGHDRSLLVMGDEYTVMYSLGQASPVVGSPKNRRLSTTSSGVLSNSPRGANTRRSPQAEMFGPGKKRKSSVSKVGEERWEMKPIWRVRQGFGTILAASVLHSAGEATSMLLADECGRMTALSWETHASGPTDGMGHGDISLTKVDLGMASPPTTLAPLGGPYVFVGSAAGDSQLVRLAFEPPNTASDVGSSPKGRLIPLVKGKGKARMSVGASSGVTEDSGWNVQMEETEGSVEVLEKWTSLAPVKDFAVVNDDGGAMSHLVLASGASTANSLRTVRSGVGMEELLSIEGIEGVEQVWSVGGDGSARLLCSTSDESFLLQLEPEVEVLPLDEAVASTALLTAGTVAEQILTVSKRGVVLWQDISVGTKQAEWLGDGKEVVAAQIHGTCVAVAIQEGQIRVLQATAGDLRVVHSIDDIGAEISAIDILSASPPILAIGTWPKSVYLYNIEDKAQKRLVIDEDGYAVSLSLRQTAHGSVQLLAGLSTGLMVIYDLVADQDSATLGLKGRKASRLGVSPLALTAVHLSGEQADSSDGQGERIVALGLSERMSVIFESKGRVDFSSVSKRGVVAASTAAYNGGQALVLASSTGLTISRVNSLKKLSIQTVDTGELSATRLAYCPVQKLLAAGVVQRHMSRETGDIEQRASLELRDPVTMQVKASLNLQTREIVTALRALTFKGREFLVAGTAVFAGGAEFEDAALSGEYRVTAREGRVLIIDPKSSMEGGNMRRLEIGVLHKTIGPVHDVAMVNGLLAVASASQVTILRLTLSPLSLTQKHTFTSTFIAQHLYVLPPAPAAPRTGAAAAPATASIGGDIDMEDMGVTATAAPAEEVLEERLVIGDGMRSISVLDVDPRTGAIYRETRDMATHSVAGLGGVKDGGEGVIISDGHNNLLTFRLSTSPTSPTSIAPHASFGLHEPIVRFRPGSFAPPASAADIIRPETIFATPDGRLGVIGELTKEAGKVMTDLQRNMDKYIPPPGTIASGAGVGGSNVDAFGWSMWRRGGSELIKRDTAGFVDGDFVGMLLDPDNLSAEARQKALSGNSEHEQVQVLLGDGSTRSAEETEVMRVLEALAGTH